jgi:hypothetical protein
MKTSCAQSSFVHSNALLAKLASIESFDVGRPAMMQRRSGMAGAMKKGFS